MQLSVNKNKFNVKTQQYFTKPFFRFLFYNASIPLIDSLSFHSKKEIL